MWAHPVSVRAARLLGFPNVGPLPGDPGGAVGLVRPDGVHLQVDGPLVGIVRSTTFTGTRTRVLVALEGGEALEAEVPSAGAPEIGARVRLRIDPKAVVPLVP